MSLEGLRAWIGEVERKLGKRTRVFLILTVLAVGIGGAAIYLAIDARESSVNESDVQALQQQLEAQIAGGAGGAAAPQAAQLEVELRALQAEVAELKSGGSGQQKQGKGASGGTPDTTPESPTGGAPPAAKLGEVLEQSKEGSTEAE